MLVNLQNKLINYSCLLLYPNCSATVIFYNLRQYVKVMNFCLCYISYLVARAEVFKWLELYILLLFYMYLYKNVSSNYFFPNFLGTLCNKTPMLTTTEVLRVFEREGCLFLILRSPLLRVYKLQETIQLHIFKKHGEKKLMC